MEHATHTLCCSECEVRASPNPNPTSDIMNDVKGCLHQGDTVCTKHARGLSLLLVGYQRHVWSAK